MYKYKKMPIASIRQQTNGMVLARQVAANFSYIFVRLCFMKPSQPFFFQLRTLAGVLLLAALPALFAFSASRINKVSLNMESVTVEKGRKVVSRGEIYYEAGSGSMVTHLTYPLEQIFISNRFGEVKMYDPRNNAVAIKQDLSFNTRGTVLYFFLSSNASDLGLREMGFTLTDTKYEGQFMISRWNAPTQMAEALSGVKLVHDGYRPVYMEYQDPKMNKLRKVYFSNFQLVLDVELPMRITEVNFFEDGQDSAVSRIDYSNILVNEQAQSSYFEYEIPEDATVVE